MDKLDNPVWHALSSSQKNLSQGDDFARRYDPEFTSLAGVADEADQCFHSLGKLLPERTRLGLITAELLRLPDPLRCIYHSAVVQMVCERLIDCRPQEFVELTADDVPAMKALVEITQPGPFANRTIEFGTFIGIKDNGNLVAMAGERMRIEDWQEVSAVCTHPDYQARGYARALVHEISSRIFERGQTPFLHVRADNLAGIKSYEKVGFKMARSVNFQLVSKKQK